MGFLDGIASSVGGSLGGLLGQGGGDAGQHAGILDAVLNADGGIGGLLARLQSGGLGAAVSSWIGTGANQPVTPDQVHAALPADLVTELARKAGLDPSQFSSGLAQVLPNLVDKLTPNGTLPQGNGLQDALGGLLNSFTGRAG